MNILIIEDNVSLAKLITMFLESEGISCTSAENGYEGLSLLNDTEFDVLLTDIRLPKISGYEIFEKAKKINPDMPVIIMTAFGNVPDAVSAVKNGAFDYITKPFENDHLLNSIKNAIEISRVRKENRHLKEFMKTSNSPVMAGQSRAFNEMLKLAGTVAPTDAPVLIIGESGTGKELAAKKIHSLSQRAEKPFVAVNCAAIPEQLFESELFGHKKGAFTGADKDFKGKISEAEGGTLFLDEIGEMPLNAQAKLLRFLQESEIQPVGSAKPVKVNVRIIAATNKDLRKYTSEGGFREDLFYRLNVFPVEIPPLSARREDIGELIALFSKKYGAKITFSDKAVARLKQAEWRGNIRELENAVYRVCILKGQGEVTEKDLPSDVGGSIVSCLDMNLPEDMLDLEELEKNIIKRSLEKFGGNRSRTAKYLNIQRHVLIYRLEKYGISD